MTDKKHTPGPWRAIYFNAHDDWDVDHQRHKGEGDAGCFSVIDSLTEANARLIAAAPDMLAELETLRAVFDDYCNHHLIKGDVVKAAKNHAHLDRIVALIKKASPQ